MREVDDKVSSSEIETREIHVEKMVKLLPAITDESKFSGICLSSQPLKGGGKRVRNSRQSQLYNKFEVTLTQNKARGIGD